MKTYKVMYMSAANYKAMIDGQFGHYTKTIEVKAESKSEAVNTVKNKFPSAWVNEKYVPVIKD